jgi:hypothetical protein
MDELKIYNRSLSTAEVNADKAAGQVLGASDGEETTLLKRVYDFFQALF